MGSAAELHQMGPHHYSSAPVNVLLDRLDRVTQYGTGWRAKCPAHDGKSTSSVSIALGDDGRILLHCFGGCEVTEVLAAVGLEVSDLFPERITHNTTPEQRRKITREAKWARWEAARSMLELEGWVVWVAGKQIHAGESLNTEDSKRLDVALTRISDARGVIYGKS